jgi:hypothetical protein
LERVRKLPIAPAAPPKGIGFPSYEHTIWGQLSYGEGYIYGPTNRRSGMTSVDIDRDGDCDFVFPSSVSPPQVMVNLGSSTAFYPGGSKTLDADELPEGLEYDLGIEFADVTGDGREDMFAVTRERDPLRKRVVWFRNEGITSGSLPSFSYQGIVYSSPQSGIWDGIWVSLGDIDGDGDADMYVTEAFTYTGAPWHRVYFVENTGTATEATWAARVVVPQLTNLLPDRLPVKALKNARAEDPTGVPLSQKMGNGAKGESDFSYNLGDAELLDWDADGLLDYMFYHRSEGLYWVPNVGTATNPVWSTSLGSGGAPRYDHREIDDISLAEGTIDLSPNPDAVKPGAEWLRDVFISVNSRLKTYRFFVEEGSYRIVQENPVAFPAGQGPAAFWDYDGDGDQDLFRMGFSSTAFSSLLLFPNAGTPYSPAWGPFRGMSGVTLEDGTGLNQYRNALYQFADYDFQGDTEFFVLGQDGRVSRYDTTPAATSTADPMFALAESNFGDVVAPGHVDVVPTGLALADFNFFDDSYTEMLVTYTHSGGSNLVLVDPFTADIYDVPEVFPNLLPAPGGGVLNMGLVESLSPTQYDDDGVPDLLVTLSNDADYENCNHHLYRTVLDNEEPYFHFEYVGVVGEPGATDDNFARMPALVDIDADGDDDLFMAHRYPPDDARNLGAYLRYYRNDADTGLQYVRFRVVSGREWPLRLDLTTGGGSNTVTVSPEYFFVNNASGAVLLPDALYRAGATAPSVDVLETLDLMSEYDFPDEVRTFVDVLPPVSANESKAIVVVGDVSGGALYPTFAGLGNWAYYVLQSEGLSKNSIRFYADSALDGDRDGVSDVTGKPTLVSLQQSITTWAQGTDRLLVYLVDHGRRDQFRMNATEFLDAGVYDNWLDTLQSNSPGTHVTTIIDTCESGTFIDNLAGANRVTMTSAGAGPIEGIALFDKTELISFSLHFWNRLFNGDSYGKAFSEAKTAIEAVNPLQAPQIDDDGDGVANEANDGLIAEGLRPGANFDVRGASVFVGEISPNRTLNSNSATLWLSDVVAPLPIEGAKAIIVPPNFERPTLENNDEEPVSDLPSVLFGYNAALDRWEGTYNGFTQGGLFQIQYFVKTGGQFFATPRIGFVDRVGIPDAWEPDNSPGAAPWITINTVQGHNFHVENDRDWVRFTSPNGPATIAVISPRPRCQAVVELFRASDLKEGKATAVRTETAAEPGAAVVFEQNFNSTDQYLIRVSNLDGSVAGEDTSYLLLVAVGTGGTVIVPTALFLTVTDGQNGSPLGNANVTFDGDSVGATNADGIAQVVVPDYGNYTLAATRTGYTRGSMLVRVNNNIENAVLALQPESSEGEGEGEGEGAEEGEGEGEPEPQPTGCAGCSEHQGTIGGAMGDIFVMTVVAAALMIAALRTRRREAVRVRVKKT